MKMISAIIIITLTLSFNASCAWFLYHSFFSVGLPTLHTMGAGAIWEGKSYFFGARWELIESTLKQKAEVAVGLFFLLLVTIGNIVISFFVSSPPSWVLVLLLCFISFKFTVILCSFFYYIIVPFLYYIIFIRAVKESLYHQLFNSGEKAKKENKETWLGSNSEENLKAQIRCYHLNAYENRAFRVLKKYLDSISNSHDPN